jgi:hypothetical protein
MLAPESTRAAGTGAKCARDCPRVRRPAVAVVGAAWGNTSVAADGLKVSVSCRVPEVTCGGLCGSAATTSRFSSIVAARRGTGGGVKRSCGLMGGLDTQFRVHASQRSPGCETAAWRIAAPLSHALVGRPGSPATPATGAEVVVIRERGGLGRSSIIRKPLPGVQSLTRGGGEEEGMMKLGAREMSMFVPE